MISRYPGFGFPIEEGMPVSLRCEVEANPPSRPVWVKDDGPPPVAQSGDGFLNFSAISRQHSGWYKCTSGDASSLGYFLNVLYTEPEATSDSGRGEGADAGTAQPALLEAALGGSVSLQCPGGGGGGGCWGAHPGAGAGARCQPTARHDLASWRQLAATSRSPPRVVVPLSLVTAAPGETAALRAELCGPAAEAAADRVLWAAGRRLLRPGDVEGRIAALPLLIA
ncbi:uncharacterized protein LOC126150929 [Schistocerca cancellata]|uniref:uncharacterized protein LOC126150929 n=1 Tax=Schistocerca cancellata TaxID=274614 RepID=UPI0021193065|nr:uncharacterized protein LOC126150929 [Schistocerca cancellata]